MASGLSATRRLLLADTWTKSRLSVHVASRPQHLSAREFNHLRMHASFQQADSVQGIRQPTLVSWGTSPGRIIQYPLYDQHLPSILGFPRKTVHLVLPTKAGVEIKTAAPAKEVRHETNHAGERSAGICRDRLHGSAHCAKVA